MKKGRTSILLSGIAVSVLFVLSSCLKSVDPPAATPPKAYVSIMHLAPTAPSLDVYFSDKKVTNTPFAPGNVTVAYNAIDRGAFPITFKKAGSDSIVASVSSAQYDSLNFYTLFIYNTQVNGPVQVVRIRDDFSNLTTAKPFYRFLHASPNTGAVDLYLNNVKIESNRSLADNIFSTSLNSFVGINGGTHTFQIKLAGTDTVIATLDNADLQTGNGYTIYLRGLSGVSGTSQQLSVGLLRAVN